MPGRSSTKVSWSNLCSPENTSSCLALLRAKLKHNHSELSLLGTILEVPMGVAIEGLPLDPVTKTQLVCGKTDNKDSSFTYIYDLMAAREAGDWRKVTKLGKELDCTWFLSLHRITRRRVGSTKSPRPNGSHRGIDDLSHAHKTMQTPHLGRASLHFPHAIDFSPRWKFLSRAPTSHSCASQRSFSHPGGHLAAGGAAAECFPESTTPTKVSHVSPNDSSKPGVPPCQT